MIEQAYVISSATMTANERMAELSAIIELAFADVQLGNGIGLWEAQGIDDYEDEATCAAYRLKDEKQDWRRIPIEDLNRCYSSPSFFDGEGMRFHLPAFLIAELRGEYGHGFEDDLTRGPGMDGRFSLLTSAQREAVRAFLRHIADLPDHAGDREQILASVEGFWREDGDGGNRL